MRFAILFVLLAASAAICRAQSGTVVLIVEQVLPAKGGNVSAGIFQAPDFPNVGKQKIGREVKADAPVVTIVFNQVPAGDYAVAVFQDIDGDKDLKTNFVGLPQEPIGFSNDARIKFGPPSFESARFRVEPNGETRLKIILR